MHSYIAPRLGGAIAHATGHATLRRSSPARPLRETDRAIRAIRDLTVTVTEAQGLDHVCDQMFRLGEPALLVARDGLVVGIITAQAARAASRRNVRSSGRGIRPQSSLLKVADVMTPVDQIASIDWAAVENAQVRDLLRMLEERATKLLLVALHVSSTSSIVRGLIHRDRLERQLGASWLTRWPSWMRPRPEG